MTTGEGSFPAPPPLPRQERVRGDEAQDQRPAFDIADPEPERFRSITERHLDRFPSTVDHDLDLDPHRSPYEDGYDPHRSPFEDGYDRFADPQHQRTSDIDTQGRSRAAANRPIDPVHRPEPPPYRDAQSGSVGWQPDPMAVAPVHRPVGPPRQRAPRRSLGEPRKASLPTIGVGLAVIVAAGSIGWFVNRSTDADEVSSGQVDLQTDEAPAPPAPARLPTADEPGLLALELPLIDPYTGTGSTGTAQLYFNSLSGQVCHQFEAPAMGANSYHAYLHQAQYPKEGPIVIDLGEVTNSVPRCVTSNPIDLTRTLANSDDYYIAAHGEDRSFLLRGQMSSAEMVFDNRDPTLIASQEAAAATTDTTAGDGSAADLFGIAEEGAYLVVDAGRISFEGEVPDVATADLLRSAFVPLLGRGVEVTDNLVVTAGSPAPSGKVVVAGALLFDIGQDQLKSDPEVLDTIVDLMTVNPTWAMTITGHTDDVGDWLTNVELSLRRADNVRRRLVDLGIPEERLRVQGAGPEQPIGDNQTPEGRTMNRRIEISIDS